MKITTVSYQKTFIIGPYQNEKIGFEAEIDQRVEHPDQVLTSLKDMAENWHKISNPHLQAHPGEDKTGGGSHTTSPQQGPEVIDYKKWERFEIDIDNAETSDELELIIKQVDTFPGRLLSTINAKRQALKPKEFTDGLE